MPGQVTIGKVAVKVVPDTTDFRKDLRRQLNALEKGLKIKIGAELDERQLRREVNRVLNKMNSPAEKAGREIEFGTRLDERNLDRASKRVEKVLGSGADRKIRLGVDPSSYDSVQQAIAEIDRRIAEMRKVPIEADLDEDQLRDLRGRLTEWLDTTSITLKVNDDVEGWKAAANRLRQIIRERTAVDLQVNADLDSLQRELDRFQEKIDREPVLVKFNNDRKGWERIRQEVDQRLADLSAEEINLNVDEESLRNIREKFDKLINDYDGKEIELQAQAEALAARAELARVARTRIVTLVVNVSKASITRAEATLAALSGLRMLRSTLDNIWDLFKNLDKNIPIIGTIAEAALGLSAALLAAASNTFALARSLAQIGSLALLLPGLAGGFAFGIGAAVASLRDFNVVLPEVGRKFSDLQDSMSDAFWAGAEQPIRNLIDGLFPQLSRGLENTSVLLGHWFGSLADSLRGALDGSLDSMFTNLAQSIGIAAGANDAMATSIRILGQYGAAYLPRLAKWWVDINRSFADWLTRADRSGKLFDWIEIGLQNLRSLGGVLAQTGRILAGFARAANEAGGSSLQTLHETLRNVANTVNGEPFKSRLVNVLRAAHDAMNSISEKAGPAFDRFFANFSSTFASGLRVVGTSIGTLLDGVFTALDQPRFAQGFLDFLTGLRDGIASLAPMWPSIGAGIGAIGALAGALAREFGPLLAQVLTSLADMAVQLAPRIIPVITNLTSIVGNALDVLLPVIEAIATAIVNLGSSALSSQAGVAAFAVALVALRAALSGQAIASALAGMMSFFGRTGDVDRMTGSVKRFTAAAGGIALAVAGFAALTDWITTSGVQAPKVDQLATALERLGNSNTAANLERLNKALIPPVQKHWLLETRADIQFQGLSDGISSVADAMQLVSERAASSGWSKFIGTGDANNYLGMASTGYQQAAKSIEALDQAMAQVVTSGNAEALAVAERMLQDAARERGIAYDDFVQKHLPQYVAAQDAASVAQQTAARIQAEAVQLQNQAMADYRSAISKTASLSPTLIDSINETSKEFINLGEAMQGDALPSVDAWISKLEEQVEAMSAWADNLAALAKRGVSEGVIAELQKLGVEGAPMVAQLVDASDSELSRLEEVMKAKIGGAVEQAGSEFSKMNDRVQAELQKLSPEAQAALAEMGIVVGETSRQAGQNVVNQFAGVAPQVGAAGQALAQAGANGVASLIPTMGARGSEAAGRYKDRMLDQATAVRSAGSSLGQNAVDGASGKQSAMGTAGADGGNAYGGSLKNTGGAATAAAADIATRAVRALVAAVSGMTGAGRQGGSGYSGGVSSSSGSASAAGRALGAAAAAGAQAVSLVQAGINAAQGFIRGLQGAVSGAVSAAKSMASSAAAAVKKTLKIKSPSRVMREFGGYTGQGFALGILDQVGSVEKAMQRIADAVSGTEFDTPFVDLDPTVRTGRGAVRSALAADSEGATARPLEVNFNAPVGGDPYEIARSIERRTNDALALEGLDL